MPSGKRDKRRKNGAIEGLSSIAPGWGGDILETFYYAIFSLRSILMKPNFLKKLSTIFL